MQAAFWIYARHIAESRTFSRLYSMPAIRIQTAILPERNDPPAFGRGSPRLAFSLLRCTDSPNGQCFSVTILTDDNNAESCVQPHDSVAMRCGARLQRGQSPGTRSSSDGVSRLAG